MLSSPFRYHFYDREGTVTIPRADKENATETKQVYSLKKAMDQLRRTGVEKGIADAGVTSVGKSYEGRDILALKVGKGSQHKVLFSGCHHSREWISVEIPLLVAAYLIETYDPLSQTPRMKRLRHLLMNREIWFVPMVNPDGHEYSRTMSRAWRPTRKPYTFPKDFVIHAPQYNGDDPFAPPTQFRDISVDHQYTYVGVDSNRNYPTRCWGQETYKGKPEFKKDEKSGVMIPQNIKTSRDPYDCMDNSIWCGPEAASEVEVKAMVALMKAQKFRAGITYHNFGELFLFPDEGTRDPFLQFVGLGMNQLVKTFGDTYTYDAGSGLYPATGDFMDYTFEQTRRPSFLPELRPADADAERYGFSQLPESEIKPCFREMLPAALALINCAGHDNPAAPLKTEDTAPEANQKRRLKVVQSCWQVFANWSID